MISRVRASLAAALVLSCPALAHAHVSISSGPAFANTSQKISFGVGHGCEGFDTYSIRVEIPAGVSSVRPISSVFGKAQLEKDDAGTVTAVIWQRQSVDDVLPEDLEYYELTIRARVADQPFTTLYFPTYQICRAPDGSMPSTDWVAMTEGGDAEPAPALTVVPARQPGWNKLTTPAAVTDLAVFFKDAQIVWKGSAAYSSNAATVELIKGTEGVTELTKLAAGDEIWVKY